MKSILLVEGSRFLRRATEQTLVRAGYVVLTAGDGEEGLRIARARIPDLILLDMLLPKLGGPEVLHALKTSALTAHIPVIVLSSLSQKNEPKLMKVGARAYFEKSKLGLDQHPDSLIYLVKKTLNGSAKRDADLVPTCGDECHKMKHAEDTMKKEDYKMTKENGFSLIELLIVVAIILIIAAIAIPNLLRARMAANESSAVASIRTINTAQITYNSAYPTVGYSVDLKSLGGASPCTPASTSSCLIDNVLATATAAPGKSGYLFTVVGTLTSYFAGTKPSTANQTGIRGFCSVEDAVLRVDPAGTNGTDHAGCLKLLPLNQ